MYQLPDARTYVNNLLQIAYINTTSQKSGLANSFFYMFNSTVIKLLKKKNKYANYVFTNT